MENRIDHARNPALDGLRGIAVLLVLLNHAVTSNTLAVFTPSGRLERLVTAMGAESWVGVDLFFVLSGFLITGILLKTREAPAYFRNFYARRFLRIFPLYYLYVAALVWVLPHLLPGDTELAAVSPRQGWLWAYLSNFEIFRNSGSYISFWTDHTWSLSVEEQFYLVWPLLVAWLGARRLVWASLAVFALQAPLRWWMAHSGFVHFQMKMATFSHLDGLMLGAAIAALGSLGEGARRLRVFAAAGLLGLAPARYWLSHSGMDYAVAREIFSVTAWSAFFAGLLVFSVQGAARSPLNRVLSSRLLVFFGTYSYGIYLVHLPIFKLVYDHIDMAHATLAGCWARALLVSLPLTLVLAYALYHLYEMRFLRLKRFFAAGGGGRSGRRAPETLAATG